jgi:hypothetical protein
MPPRANLPPFDAELARELTLVPRERLVRIIRDSDIDTEDLRSLIRDAHPYFRMLAAPEDPSSYLDNLTVPELAQVMLQGQARPEADLRALCLEYQHDFSPVFNLFVSNGARPLLSLGSQDFERRFEESLQRTNREIAAYEGSIRNVRLVEPPRQEVTWPGWEIKWSYELLLTRRRPDSGLIELIPDLRYGYVWVIPDLRRLVIQASDMTAVRTIVKALNSGFELDGDRVLTTIRLHDKMLSGIVERKNLRRISMRGIPTVPAPDAGQAELNDLSEAFSRLDSLSMTARDLGTSPLPRKLEATAEMQSTATTYTTAYVEAEKLRTIYLGYARGRLSAAGNISLSKLRNWAWTVLESISQGTIALMGRDRRVSIQATGYAGNEVSKRLPAGEFREAMNTLIGRAAEMLSYATPTTTAELPAHIMPALSQARKYTYPALVQWDCHNCSTRFNFSCPRCKHEEFFVSPDYLEAGKVTCANEACGRVTRDLRKAAEDQFCLACQAAGSPPTEVSDSLVITFTPEGNDIVNDQLRFISIGYEQVHPNPRDIFQIVDGALHRRRAPGTPEIELADLRDFRRVTTPEALSKSRMTELRKFAFSRGEMCKAVKNRRIDKYHPCQTCYANIPDEKDPCLFRLVMTPLERELFTGHAATEFADQYFDVTYNNRALRAAVFGKVEKIGRTNKLTLKSESGANLLAQVHERHRHPQVDLIIILTYSAIDPNLRVALNQLCQYGGKKILYTSEEDIVKLAYYYETSWD